MIKKWANAVKRKGRSLKRKKNHAEQREPKRERERVELGGNSRTNQVPPNTRWGGGAGGRGRGQRKKNQ